MRSLARQVRFLRRSFSDVQDGPPRPPGRCGLVAAAVSIFGQERHVRARSGARSRARTPFADGGYWAFPQSAILDALIEILPIRRRSRPAASRLRRR
ncbi:MAG: hypothetical protein NVV72_11265 [Asticcacaulis sp.]|nr:hypothetical protein [Asticcacaulis sp.]